MQVSDTTALVLDRYLLGGATTGSSGGSTGAGTTKPLAQWTEAEISDFAPRIAIADRLSETSSAIAVVELKKGSLDELSDHLYQMLTQVELAEQEMRRLMAEARADELFAQLRLFEERGLRLRLHPPQPPAGKPAPASPGFASANVPGTPAG